MKRLEQKHSEEEKTLDLISLSEGWKTWPLFVLRGTGFPMEDILSVGGAELGSLSREIHKIEGKIEELLEQAISHCDQEIQTLKNDNRPFWRKLRKRFRKQRIVPFEQWPISCDGDFGELVLAIQKYIENRELHLSRFGSVWFQKREEDHAFLSELARSESFMDAVLWQNYKAVVYGLETLLKPSGKKKNIYKAELLAVKYLQRYCTKNDTIGFFGPIAYASWVFSQQKDICLPGNSLLSQSSIFFEPWALSGLVQKWSEQPEFLLDVPPRLNPLLFLDGELLFGVSGSRRLDGARSLTATEFALLQACNGSQCAREIILLLGREKDGLFTEGRVLDGIYELRRRGWLLWEFELTNEAFPEKRLKAFLKTLRDVKIRENCLKELEQLTMLRNEVFEAKDHSSRKSSMKAMNLLFQKFSGMSATRNEGQTYAGRTIVYLDAVRDLNLKVSTELLASIEDPLSLVMQSARWFTYTIAERYRSFLRSEYRKMNRGGRFEAIPLARLWRAAKSWLEPFCPEPIQEVVEELKNRWDRALKLSSEKEATCFRSCDEVRSDVMELFSAPFPGWPCARHHSPDLMFAASSFEELQAGKALAILGEVHSGLNTLSTLTMTAQNPHMEQMQALYKQDLPNSGIAPIPDGAFARSIHDSRLAVDDWHIDMGAPWSSWRGVDKVIPLGALMVREKADSLEVFSRDGRFCFDIIQVIERRLKMRSAVHFSLFSKRSFFPRVQLGNLVLSRAGWSFSADELHFAKEKDKQKGFIQLQEWADSRGMPRFLFYKSSNEVKPVYLDRWSPHLVDICCRQILNAEGKNFSFSEMLPAPEQSWLPDVDGRRYTCEFRLVCVDPSEWRSPLK